MKNNYKYCKFVVLIPLLYIILYGNLAHANLSLRKENFEIDTYFQQQISGTVRDQDGIPIPGVNVIVQGSSTGTMTNLDGEYSISANLRDTLVFSYIGFKEFKIQVNDTFSGNVTLESSIDALEEVIINAGYYNTTKRERTGNISRVTAEEIELQPVVNPIQALIGRMPGVEINQNSGITGVAPSILIRGQNSLRQEFGNNGNLPLYIVDGVPLSSGGIPNNGLLTFSTGMDPLNTLNLSNIESIEVLKDADATAIYGSRGSNGVILITTKSGGSYKKTQINARIYSGVAEVSRFMNLLNTEEHLSVRRQAFANDGLEPTENNAEDLLLWDQNRYTDWQKVFFGGTANIKDVSISANGGTAKTGFILGGSYHKEGTVFPGDFGYHKVTANAGFNHRSDDNRLSLNLNLNYGIDRNKLFSNSSFIRNAIALSPNAPEIYNEDGSLNWADGSWTNPFAILRITQDAQTKNFLASAGMSYEILDGLKFKTTLGYTDLRNEEIIRTPKTAYIPEVYDRVIPTSTNNFVGRSSWIVEPQLSFDYASGNSNLSIITGLTFQKNTSSLLRINASGYSQESLIGNLAAADEISINNDDEIIYAYAAAFGRIGYKFKDKYFINLTGRRDGSSRFGPNNRFSNFGAIGAAWIFSEENFWLKSFPWMSFGKLRTSYGTTGNDQIPDYAYLDIYEATSGPGGLYPTRLTNPDFSWEKNKKLEVALELGFLDQRINLSTSWYRNRSSNQLVGYPLPAITGFTSVQANFPATVQNTGWEFDLSAFPFKHKTFTWETGINLTIPNNKLVSFPNIEETSYANIYQVGAPLNIVFRYQYEGIDPETGFHRVKDVNEDGVYNQEDQIVVKELGRQYYGGFFNHINYRNFNLQALLEFVKQDGLSHVVDFASAPGNMGNQEKSILNAWQTPGDQSSVQRYSTTTEGRRWNSRANASDLNVTDNSFLRLKTLTLSYSFPSKLVEQWRLENLGIYVHGQNLFTITNYKGLDPQGGLVLPQLRSYNLGIQVKF